ncbi:MAG TPA: MMPL family transporter [Streptosporangiaceae bacterium]|nr:MMPL family transporter [Streptosporangiaceae bacterium]
MFHAKHGTVSASKSAVNQATSNVAKLPHVIGATSPFASSNSGQVSKDGTIAYTSASWNVNPDSLSNSYLDKLNKAVEPARKAGLTVDYGAGAGNIGQQTNDLTSEGIGLACALALLLFMFGSLIAAAIPLLSALCSVGAGLSLLGLLASAITFPTTAPTIATLLGLGVAIDYGLFLTARHREQLDQGMDVTSSVKRAESTSGAAIVVAGSTVVISILGLYIAGVTFVGSLGLAAAVVVALTFSIVLGQPDNGTNPASDSNKRAFVLIKQGFGTGVNGPLTVVVKLPKESSQTTNSKLSTMQSDLAHTHGVKTVSPPVVNKAGTVAVLNVIPTTRPQATATTNLVKTLRNTVLPNEHLTTYVTGTTAGTVDFTDRITARLVWLIVAVIAISFLLLTMAFRSIVIATKAAILNLLSIGAAVGVIVAIFQYGWGASLIGLHTTLPIPAYVPMLVFCIVFGLSMDYEVFLLSRVHEAWLVTGDERRSVAIGIGATARVITTAAAIMVTVFASFVLNSDPTVKMLVIGMAFAVLIDASVVRMVLVPSIMTLLGRYAWWMPHWMEPIVPQLHLEDSQSPPVGPQPATSPAQRTGTAPRR